MQIPICTHLLAGTRLCHGKVHYAQHFLQRYLPQLGPGGLLNASSSDLLVINFGLWWVGRRCACCAAATPALRLSSSLYCVALDVQPGRPLVGLLRPMLGVMLHERTEARACWADTC